MTIDIDATIDQFKQQFEADAKDILNALSHGEKEVASRALADLARNAITLQFTTDDDERDAIQRDIDANMLALDATQTLAQLRVANRVRDSLIGFVTRLQHTMIAALVAA